MLRRLITGLMTMAATAVALAGPQTYATRVQSIRAGIVVLSSSHTNTSPYPETVAPFAFYNLSINNSVKPVGWNIYNPHAPARVDSAIYERYTGLSKGPADPGTELTKRDAPYWEVFLDSATTNDLGDYDILLVAPKYHAALTPIEREKLRAFVDHGGILWIDPSALPYDRNGVDPFSNFPVAFETRNIGQAGLQRSDFQHPLLSRPFSLTATDVNILNTGLPNAAMPAAISAVQTSDLPANGSGFDQFLLPDTASFTTLRPVTLVNNSETMGVAQLGDGYVVVTARGAAVKLNRVSTPSFSYTNNRGYTSRQPAVLEQDGLVSAKLVVNMISLLSEFRQQGSGAHKSGGSAIDVGAPLLNRGHDRTVTFPAGNTYGAVVYKGMVIASVEESGGWRVVAYDPNPSRDLDNDGNANDGLNVGDNPSAGADIVWRSALSSVPISMPVVAEIPDADPSVAPTDQVLVVDANGNLSAFNPIVRVAGSQSYSHDDNRAAVYTVGPPQGMAPETSGGPPAPPTVHEGLAYVADTVDKSGLQAGRIWVVDMRHGKAMTSDTPWYLGGSTSPFQAQPFAISPTIGYIPILDNSGGSDKVMYLPMKSQGNTPAGIVSVWLGARAEKPASTPTISGGALQVETRASQQGGLPVYVRTGGGDVAALNPKLMVLDSNGTPWSASRITNTFSGTVSESGGVLSFGIRGALTTLPVGTEIRVDYNIDWGDTSFQGVAESIKRGILQIPDISGSPKRDITGPIALTAKGSIFACVSGNGRAALYGFREEGRGSFRCTVRYELSAAYKFSAQGRSQDSFAPVVEDHDPVVNFRPDLLDQPFTAFNIVGGPSVRNDQVFISVSAYKSIVPTMILMAFASEPEVARFRVDNVPDGSVLVQPDLARSNTTGVGAVADVPTVLPSANYQWDSDTHILRIDNLMNIPKGQIQQCMSLSQPLYLRTPGGSDVPLIPDDIGGSSWSPLLWYSVVNGYTPSTGPLVTGDTMFVGGQSAIVKILTSGTPFPFDGLIYAMSSTISPTDDNLKITPGRPWLKQLYSLAVDDNGILGANPDIKWPQTTGISGMNDYIIRLNQTVLRDSNNVIGIAGGDGTLVALGTNGLYTYNRADVVVADQNRIAIFDAGGNPVWSTTSSAEVGPNGASGTIHKVVRPTRAYRLNETELLVVDSGANRVFRMDLGGIETRSLSGFKLDPGYQPSGYSSNEPLTLNEPRDATTYSNVVYFPQAGGVSLGDGESPTGYEYWDHYLVADAGNHRLVEMIDRYGFDVANQRVLDPITVGGVAQIGVLFWHSPAMVAGKAYDYNSISRIALPTGEFVYIAGVGSVLPTATDTGAVPADKFSVRESSTGNGGIVIFDPLLPNLPVVFNSVQIPSLIADRFWNESTGTFSSPASASYTKYFSNVASVSTTLTGSGNSSTILIMISDSSGIYEATYVPGVGTSGTTLGLNWMLPNNVYRTMRFAGGVPEGFNPANLRVVYAQRVDDDNVLIVNGYYGKYRDGSGPFQGEVIQIDGRDLDLSKVNLGFSTGSITLKLSSVVGTRGLVLPAFADRG